MSSSPQHIISPRQSEVQSISPQQHNHSPTSLAAAAALNAGLQNEERTSPSHGSLRQNPHLERRRSSIRMSIAMNDDSRPAPGELAASPAAIRRGSISQAGGPPSPTRHIRAPSLGELHQELENEQEARVNRLLGMIRRQQAEIETLQSQQPNGSSSTAIDDSNPPSDVSRSQTPSHSQRRQVSMSQALASSTSHSHSPSPSLRAQQHHPHHINTEVAPIRMNSGSEDFSPLNQSSSGNTINLRDESAFYQAETQSMMRENQMLKSRIRELERQLQEGSGHGAAVGTHSPVRHSSLQTENLPSDMETSR